MQKRFLTGMRPTNRLTIGNYLGGIKPLLEMQKLDEEIYLFVASLHGITDNEPADIVPNIFNIVGDYIAAGIDPRKVVIYDQYDLRQEITLISNYLSREVTTSRLLRLPTLKDKVRNGNAEQANAALLMYPILMTADIVCQNATHVPVGRDQKPHLEITREIVRSINQKYGSSILVSPRDYSDSSESVNILSLRGNGKMSKSNPEGAIFLYDTVDELAKKIKRAETGVAGSTSEQIESLLVIADQLDFPNKDILQGMYKQHINGEKVMGEFKKEFSEHMIDFTRSFQAARSGISDEYVRSVLSEGALIARKNAQLVREKMEQGMGF